MITTVGRINPEFLRNLWLELTPQRVVLMPVVLSGIFLLAFLGGDNDPPMVALAWCALFCFIVLAYIYGCNLAAQSISEERRDRTWEFQRMSSISAWKMTWGKLFGGTIFAWYGCALCAVVFVVSGPFADFNRSVMYILLMYTLGAICAQAATIVLCLDNAPSREAKRQHYGFAAFIIGAAVAKWVFGFTHVMSDTRVFQLGWYGMEPSRAVFYLISISLFAAWAVVGVYRLMLRHLQYQVGPGVWFLFVLFLMVYSAGFVNLDHNLQWASRFLAAFFLGLVLTYFSVFKEEKNPVTYRKLFGSIARLDVEQIYLNLPRWFVALVPTGLCAIAVIALGETNAVGFNLGSELSVLPALFFGVRDIVVLLILTITGSGKRAHASFIVFLAVFYLLIPLLLKVVGATTILGLFLPTPGTSSIPALLEALLVIGIFYSRYQRDIRMLEFR